jgi:tetratricopeptide (TPR) repeat protein
LQEGSFILQKKSKSFKLQEFIGIRWEKGFCDFKMVTQLAPRSGLGYLGTGDSLYGLQNYNGSIKAYSKAIEIDNSCQFQAYEKRGTLLYKLQAFDESIQDFDKVFNFLMLTPLFIIYLLF